MRPDTGRLSLEAERSVRDVGHLGRAHQDTRRKDESGRTARRRPRHLPDDGPCARPGGSGDPPARIATSARCVLDQVGDAPRITSVAIGIRAEVPGLTGAVFAQAVDKVAALCLVSNALRGNAEIAIDARLEGALSRAASE